MNQINIVLISVLLFVTVNAKSIHQQQVSITNLNMEQYRATVKHSQNVWIIQLCHSNKTSEAFEKAAFVLRGIAKAGFINCFDRENCNEIFDDEINGDENKKPTEKIVFIHSEGVENDFKHTDDFNLIVNNTVKLIDDKIEYQKKNVPQLNIQIVEFSTEDF